MAQFNQDGPQIENTFLSDAVLQDYLKATLPEHVHNVVKKHLTAVGAKATTLDGHRFSAGKLVFPL